MIVRDYWQTNDSRKDQYFYIAFALLASGVNDYAVGRDLHLARKLNWAASAYYYSMVHASRLVLFLVYGDFPTQHRSLADAFGNGVHRASFWFTEFARSTTPAPDRSNPNDYKRQEVVYRYEQMGMDRRETDRMFEQWADVLQQAKTLRENSNYESLLIAHEHNHIIVTQAFDRLCKALKICAERVLVDTVRLFKTTIDNSPRGKHWLAFLNHTPSPPDLNLEIHDHEGLLYMEKSVQSIVEHGMSVSDALSLVQPLRSAELANPLLADEVHKHIVVDTFSGKKNKMREFEHNILRLEETLHQASQTARRSVDSAL
jgi:hypothetical protein